MKIVVCKKLCREVLDFENLELYGNRKLPSLTSSQLVPYFVFLVRKRAFPFPRM